MRADKVEAHLTPKQVVQVFERYVPGVQRLVYQQTGEPVLRFIVLAYQSGLPAFRNTPLHGHLTSLLRLLVHRGHKGASGIGICLQEVAEAFTDCQAVQARTIERLGLRARGVTGDFRSMVVGLLGQYKMVAVRTLAYERTGLRSVRENKNNVHLENRLTADLGKHVGLDAVDVRRAELDEHARDRFPRLRGSQAAAAAARCRQLFDVEALLGALAAEIGGLAEDSSAESFPRAFLTWASEHMTDQHVLLDEETLSRIEVEQPLALAILETLFLGRPRAAAGELYRDKELQGLFR